MRKISILFMFSFFSMILLCQSQSVPKKDNTANNDTTTKPARIIIRCGYTCNNQTPLIILDGVPITDTKIKDLNPNDIDSIWILRDAAGQALYDYRAGNGVILITTKQNKFQKFVIKDSIDDSTIPGATVSFVAIDKTDSVMTAADDSGTVSVQKLKSSKKYVVRISAVGYKTCITIIDNNYWYAKKEFKLERSERYCTEVIISCPVSRAIHCGMRSFCIINEDQFITPGKKLSTAKVFPNPVQRGGMITIEYEAASASLILFKISGLDGRVLLHQKQQTMKGINHFALNAPASWAAGVYLLQIYENGRVAASERIIIQ